MNKEEAINLMQEKGEIYKVELIEEMEDEEVSFTSRVNLWIFAGDLISFNWKG